jgi:hypothetical protein
MQISAQVQNYTLHVHAGRAIRAIPIVQDKNRSNSSDANFNYARKKKYLYNTLLTSLEFMTHDMTISQYTYIYSIMLMMMMTDSLILHKLR